MSPNPLPALEYFKSIHGLEPFLCRESIAMLMEDYYQERKKLEQPTIHQTENNYEEKRSSNKKVVSINHISDIP